MTELSRKETVSQLRELFCRLDRNDREKLLKAGEEKQQLKRGVENKEKAAT